MYRRASPVQRRDNGKSSGPRSIQNILRKEGNCLNSFIIKLLSVLASEKEINLKVRNLEVQLGEKSVVISGKLNLVVREGSA